VANPRLAIVRDFGYEGIGAWRVQAYCSHSLVPLFWKQQQQQQQKTITTRKMEIFF
jgi:hypothetical protein